MASLIERRSYEPKRFYAGEFPVVTETGTAGEAIAQYDLIGPGTDGLIKVAADTDGKIGEIAGIAVSAAKAKGDPVVYILTGEVFADSVGLNGVDLATAKAACRKLSIFLK